MDQQLLFTDETNPKVLELPALEIGPLRVSIGEIRQVLRPSLNLEVKNISSLRVSARTSEPVYELETGERIIITRRRNLQLPEGVAGILRELDDGTLKWDQHEQTNAILKRTHEVGWEEIARSISSTWNDRVRYRAETANLDGKVTAGNEGLRPPQLGALHAIGAHWSVFRTPATIVMPTGTGKTETMLSALAAYVRAPMLVVVPSDILRSQTARKFLTFGLLRKLGVLDEGAENPIVGVITSRPRTEADLQLLSQCNVIVTTMSSIAYGTAEPLAAAIADRVDTLIVDEAHHVKASGWAVFRDAFASKRVLQFTATPFRRDGQLVDGDVIYNYPLRQAQQDHYFKPITFESVYEIDPEMADRAIAEAATAQLRKDLGDNLNHLMMARCVSIDRAEAVFQLYKQLAPDLHPMLVHSELSDTDERVELLRLGSSRIAVCVNMLGEGFDLPELKIAAIHDLHKSLAILLQFTGRFTRSAPDNIGNATVVANIADANVSTALERLYSEDADWNQLLSELSSQAARDHAELVEFLKASRRLDDVEDTEETISHHLLRPTLSTLTYEASSFNPERFHEGIAKGVEVRAAWLNDRSKTLFFVTRYEPAIKWMRSKALRDREWSLFILHHDEERELLYLSSTDHSSTFEKMATAVGGGSKLVSGDQIFRSLGHINRLVFQSIGVKKHGRRNLRYAMYTGADVAEALSLSERAGSVKSNVSGTGWEGGRPITIGCSYKGRIWSREQGPIPRFVTWSQEVGKKLLDGTINTADIIANVLIPTEVDTLPDKPVLGADWPVELLAQSEERVVFSRGDREQPISLFSLLYLDSNVSNSEVTFELLHAEDGSWGKFTMTVGGDKGFVVTRVSQEAIGLKVGRIETTVEDYFSEYPPLVRFVDLTELDGNLLISPQHVDEISFPKERMEVWTWDDTDITKESMWRHGQKRPSSIQEKAAHHFIDADFDVVFDDDDAGEAADLVCLKEEPDHIRVALVHCKFSGGQNPGERVKDVVEVSSQAIRSAKWKWKFKDLCRHIAVRERTLTSGMRSTRFLAGSIGDVNRFGKGSRFKEVRAEILIVQPGLSQANITKDQSIVLGSAMTYLKETIGVDLDVICSS
jgi:superfamily II DNA or RNA helicase